MRSQQHEFADATMYLSDGTTLTIPEGVITIEERRGDPDPWGASARSNPLHNHLYHQLQYGGQPQVEFTLTPRSRDPRNQNLYGVTRGHTNVIISKKDLDAVAGGIVSALVAELEERDGLSIDDREDRDDIIDTLIELVTTELKDAL